mmetsp:Transcript_15844/g.36502  ORF Transcript_15844/g.36502 Transcript_15844/m.36502 type:complete len:203 (-) Transcript_15844:385-993(-)
MNSPNRARLHFQTTQLAVIHQEVELIRSLKCVARARLTAVQASVRVAPSIARVVGAADDLAVATSAPRLALSATSLPGTAVRVPLAPVTRIDVAVTRASLAAAAVASTLVAVRGVLAATGVARVARLEAAIAAIALAVVRVAVLAAPRPVVRVHVLAVLSAPASVEVSVFFLRRVTVFLALLYRAPELDLFLHEVRLVLTDY